MGIDFSCQSQILMTKVGPRAVMVNITHTSIIGLDASTFCSTCVSVSAPQTVAKYLMAYLADTVFPAPLSPDTMSDWFSSNLNMPFCNAVKKFLTINP